MNPIRAVLVAVSLFAFTGCDLFSSRQKQLERAIVGVWDNVGGLIEFSPDGTFIIRQGDGLLRPDAGAPAANVTIVVPGDNMLGQGKWSVSEDGRLRISSQQFFGLGYDVAGEVLMFRKSCRSKENVMVVLDANGRADLFTRRSR
jgi:hypothetical protein